MSDFKKKLFDTIGSVADKTKDIASKTADVTKDLTAKAGDKAKLLQKIAKLSLDISGQKDDIRDAYYEIGKLYYAAHRDDAEEDFAFLCNGITEAMLDIEKKTEAINALKSKIASGNYEDGDEIEVDFEEVDFDDVVSASEGCSGNCSCCNEEDFCVSPLKKETPIEEVPVVEEDIVVEIEELPAEEAPVAETPAEAAPPEEVQE